MSSQKKYNISNPADESALAELLNDAIDGEDSDLDFDFGDDDVDDDDPTYIPPGVNNEESSGGSDDEEPPSEPQVPGSPATANTPDIQSVQSPQSSSSFGRRQYWKTSNDFNPLPPAPAYEQPERIALNLPPKDYFSKYIPNDTYSKIAFCSNQLYIIRTGQTLSTNEKEIKTFFGITMMMSYLRFPRIRMYWETKTRVAGIADKMGRDRYFKLRANLKIVNDDEVSQEDKDKTKFWKIQPIISSVRNGCLLNTPSKDVCVDEQMIPFWGHHAARQVLKNKPNPVGLKNFVITCSNGLPLDFFIYEGKGDSILEGESTQMLDLGGKVVMRLSSRLPSGCSIYMDRYFTSIHLLDVLHFKAECSGTGTLQKNRIPQHCNFKTDAQLRREGRGSYSQQVSSSGQIAAVKWFDNKPVIMASSIHGAEPTDECRRWDRTKKRYIMIPQPHVVQQYNAKMGGVDYLDRMISYYRISARTRKWTVRTIFHFFDFSVAAGWIEYKLEQEQLGTPKRQILDLLSFKEQIVEFLMDFDVEEDAVDEADHTYSLGPQQKRAKHQHPSDTVRTKRVDHLPIVLDSKNRCRLPGCRSNAARHQCSTCGVNLCLVTGRNCYQLYHQL